MTESDARKQLLLTRIALERAQWLRAFDAVQREADPRRMASTAARAAFDRSGLGALAGLFGGTARGARQAGTGAKAAAASAVDRVLGAWTVLRRHPMWPLVASAGPWLLRRRRPLTWVGVAIGAGALVGLAALALQRRRAPDNAADNG